MAMQDLLNIFQTQKPPLAPMAPMGAVQPRQSLTAPAAIAPQMSGGSQPRQSMTAPAMQAPTAGGQSTGHTPVMNPDGSITWKAPEMGIFSAPGGGVYKAPVGSQGTSQALSQAAAQQYTAPPGGPLFQSGTEQGQGVPYGQRVPPLPEGGQLQISRDLEKGMDPLLNAFFSALYPRFSTGTATNPPMVSDALERLFAGSAVPENFDEFYKALTGQESASPMSNELNKALFSMLQGGQDQPGQDQITQALQNLFSGGGTPATGRNPLEQQLIGEAHGFGTGSSGLLSGFGDLQPEGILGSLSGIIENQGMDPRFIQAARENILGPQMEAMQGRLNEQGGGVASPQSGLFQELQRRSEQEFSNQLMLNAQGNMQGALGQGIGLQGQLAGQSLANTLGLGQADLQRLQTGAGISQGMGGQQQQNILNALSMGLGREQFTGDFAQGNIQSALEYLQSMNQFNLGQTGILGNILNPNPQQGSGLAGALGGAAIGATPALIAALAALSSKRYKQNIEDSTFEGTLDIVKSIKPRSYRYLPETGKDPDKKHLGFVLEEVDPILMDENGGIDVDMFGVLIGAIQELTAKVIELEGRLHASR